MPQRQNACLNTYRIKQLPQLVAILNGHHSSERVVLIVNFHDWLWCILYLLSFVSIYLGRRRGPENHKAIEMALQACGSQTTATQEKILKYLTMPAVARRACLIGLLRLYSLQRICN